MKAPTTLNTYTFRKPAMLLITALSVSLGSVLPSFAQAASRNAYIIDLTTKQLIQIYDTPAPTVPGVRAVAINNLGQVVGDTDPLGFITEANGIGRTDFDKVPGGPTLMITHLKSDVDGLP